MAYTWLRWFAHFALAAAAFALFLSHLGLPLLEPSEALYAEIPRQMLAEGRWLEPVRHGEPYNQKPPLMYWLVMLSYSLLGVSDAAARLVPAMAALGTIGITYAWGRSTRGPQFGFVAALILCLSGRFVYQGRMLVLDGLLALWVTIALAAAHQALRSGSWRWWCISGAACGLGMLTKGPLALILVLGPVLLSLLSPTRKAKDRTPSLRLKLTTSEESAIPRLRVGLTALCRGCCVLSAWRVSSPRRGSSWRGCTIPRRCSRSCCCTMSSSFVQPFDHAKPVWFYVPGLLGATLPWSLLLVPLCLHSACGGATGRLESLRRKRNTLPALAFAWGFVFFSLSGCKRPAYILPCLPPFALLLASGFFAMLPTTRAGWLRWGLLAGVVFGVLFVSLEQWLPGYHRQFGMRGQVRRHRDLQNLPVACYPHRWDSVSFYLQRDDVKTFSLADRQALIEVSWQGGTDAGVREKCQPGS